MRENTLFKMSQGDQEMCLVHIKDLTRAVKKAITLLELNKGISNYTLLNDDNKYISISAKNFCGFV